jgi:GNAT superfamily N-acetyltransferase
MAVTELRLGAGHLAGCAALSAAAGWNQNAADWRLMLELGEGWGLALPDGTLAASTLALPYGKFAWLSMVLVLPGQRRRGYASRLLRAALAALERGGLAPVLDATPAGREVYRREGFRDTWTFRRYVLDPAPGPTGAGVRALREDDWPWILELDRTAFGGERAAVLRALARRLPAAALVVEREGFLLGRDGRETPQLGPLVARSRAAAQALLQAGLARMPGPVYADIADHAGLARPGFTEQRPFTRMVHGGGAAPGDAARVFLVAGPELG